MNILSLYRTLSSYEIFIFKVSTQRIEFKEFDTKDLPETKELKVIKRYCSSN
jgi:hypothetical protein